MLGDKNLLSSHQSLRALNLIDLGDDADRIAARNAFGEDFGERWRKLGAIDVAQENVATDFAVEIKTAEKWLSDSYRVGLLWDGSAVAAGPFAVESGQTVPVTLVRKGNILELWGTEDESVTMRTLSIAAAKEREQKREQSKAEEKTPAELAASTAKTIGVVAVIAAVGAALLYFVVLK